jgi:hypothetical protein
MNPIIAVFGIVSLFWISPVLADDDSRGKNRCRSVPGTYISKNIETGSPDVPNTTSLRNRIVMIHRDGTIATYHSAQLDELDGGNELTPAMGNWVCVRRNVIKAVAFDYFALGIGIGGRSIGEQKWDEFDRITMRINFRRKPAVMKLRLIGIAKSYDAEKLNPDVNPTIVTNIRTYKLERIGPVRKIVEADFAR